MLRNDLFNGFADSADVNIKKSFPPSKWSLNEGLAVARILEPFAYSNNYHVAMAGSVLIKGESEKDLDIFFYQRDNKIACTADEEVMKRLVAIPGFGNEYMKIPFKYGGKTVYATTFFGKRIDIFFWWIPKTAEIIPVNNDTKD